MKIVTLYYVFNANGGTIYYVECQSVFVHILRNKTPLYNMNFE